MKKIEMISRMIMMILTFIICKILFINEDSSWNIVCVIFSLVVLGLSFPSTIFAKKIINAGNKIQKKILKIGYYVLLPVFSLMIGILSYVGVICIYRLLTNSTMHYADGGLSGGLIVLFIASVSFIIFVLPYIQAIIINVIVKIVNRLQE